MVVKAKIFGKEIGVLTRRDGGYFFEYFDDFLKSGLEISPFALPLSSRVFSGREFMAFDLIPSVFHDSLPDSFGSYLMANYFSNIEGSIDAMRDPLRKLSFMGDRAIGAIEYEPMEIENDSDKILIDLKSYIDETRKILLDKPSTLISMITSQPSPGGARPKAFVYWDKNNDLMQVGKPQEGYEPWIVKFYEKEQPELTRIEYIYLKIASLVGLEVPEFDAITFGDEFHFAVKRFDRVDGQKIHAHTLSGLLNRRFDERGLISYEDLLKTTLALTKNLQDVKKTYQVMVFNIIGQNSDDHAKNFSFLMDERGSWRFAPAYDIVYTFGSGDFKEHFLTINKKRKAFTQKELINIGTEFGLSKQECKEIVQKTEEGFSHFVDFAKDVALDAKMIAYFKDIFL